MAGGYVGFLCRCGYADDQRIRAFYTSYLPAIARIAEDQLFDIYAGECELVGLPGAWRGKPIVRPAVMRSYYLIKTYDLLVLARFPPQIADGASRARLDRIIEYVLDPRAQSFHRGYGYSWNKERRRCYHWGYSPHLPGYGGFEPDRLGKAQSLVQRLLLLACFSAGRRSDWLRAAVEHLEGFRTETGTYAFPASYLMEQPSGYYIHGAYMGLGENRCKRQWREIESTFRMLELRRLCGSGGI